MSHRVVDPISATMGILAGQDTQVQSDRPAQHEFPRIQLGIDGGDVIYPVLSEPLIRVTVWAKDGGEAHDKAAECQSILLGHNGEQTVSFKNPTGITLGADNDNGDEFATFTVVARMRTTL